MNRLWRRNDPTVVKQGPGGIDYLSAAGVCGLSFCFCLLTWRLFGIQLPIMAGIGAVLVSTALGGLGPGVLAIGLSLGFALWVSDTPVGRVVQPANLVAALIFETTCVVVGELALRARRKAACETAKCRAREAHLQSIFDNLPAAMLVLDEDGAICVASAEAGRLFGFAPVAMRGLPIKGLIHLPLSDSRLEPAQLRGAPATFLDEPIDGERSDGSPLKLRVALAQAIIPSGRVFTLYVGDVTAELGRLRRIQELQDEVAHMGRLTALGEMGAGIAHELNQPLSAAANYLGCARRQAEHLGEDEGAALVEVIREATQQVLRAGAVLKRLRAFVSRSGVEHRELNLRDVITETLVLARLVLQEGRVKLNLEITPNIGRICGDRVQIQQVLLNLLRNAAEAVRPSRIRTVTLSVWPTPDGVVIGVRDTGPGVAPDNVSRLFTPFNTSKSDGMGMGLAICRTIVEAHGGRIWCETPEEGGAAFFFLLPRPAGAERADAA